RESAWAERSAAHQDTRTTASARPIDMPVAEVHAALKASPPTQEKCSCSSYGAAGRYAPHDAQQWPEAGRGPSTTTAKPAKNSIRWFSCHVSLWWCLIVPDLSRTGLTAFRTKG